MVGGAYLIAGRSSAGRGWPRGRFDVALGAAGGGREGIMPADVADCAIGGRGAARLGTRLLPFIGGEVGREPAVWLRGIGGGARGFSKLSWSFLGKRGLAGGLKTAGAPYCPIFGDKPPPGV